MSRYLPDNFDASKPLALIAGKGTYPILLAERARSAGIAVRLIELGGETSEKLIKTFPDHERSAVKVGQVGKLLKELKKFNAGYAVMAGQVTPGKLFKGLHPYLKAIPTADRQPLAPVPPTSSYPRSKGSAGPDDTTYHSDRPRRPAD